MSISEPIATYGRRGTKKPRQPPPAIREAARLMVWGLPDDEEMKACDYATAARAVGTTPRLMRRWLYRDEFRSLIAKECKAFRTAIGSGNIRALWDVRENSKNPQARVAAVKTLIEMDVDPSSARPENTTSPFTINLVTYSTRDRAEPPALTIESRPISAHTVPPHPWPSRGEPSPSMPAAELPDEPELIEEPEPIDTPRFRLKRPWER
jgi:hypothetical protein